MQKTPRFNEEDVAFFASQATLKGCLHKDCGQATLKGGLLLDCCYELATAA